MAEGNGRPLGVERSFGIACCDRCHKRLEICACYISPLAKEGEGVIMAEVEQVDSPDHYTHEEGEIAPMKYTSTVFGLMLEYERPDDCDMVVLCVDIAQHSPVTLLLPYQVYRERLQELLTKHPGARGVTIIPCRSADKISIPAKDLLPRPTSGAGERG